MDNTIPTWGYKSDGSADIFDLAPGKGLPNGWSASPACIVDPALATADALTARAEGRIPAVAIVEVPGEADAEVERLRAIITAGMAENERLAADVDLASAARDAALADAETVRAAHAQVAADLAAATADVTSIRAALDAAGAEKADLLAKVDAISAELATARADLEALTAPAAPATPAKAK